jgi:hypothetical protein
MIAARKKVGTPIIKENCSISPIAAKNGKAIIKQTAINIQNSISLNAFFMTTSGVLRNSPLSKCAGIPRIKSVRENT